MLNTNSKRKIKLLCSLVLLCSVAAFSFGCGDNAAVTSNGSASATAGKSTAVTSAASAETATVNISSKASKANESANAVSKKSESKADSSITESSTAESKTVASKAKDTSSAKTDSKKSTSSKKEKVDPADKSLLENPYTPTLDDVFSEDKVRVLIKHRYSVVNAKITLKNLNDFLRIPEDGDIDRELLTFTAVEDKSLRKSKKSHGLIDWDTFHNSLVLTLKNPGKKNVLKAIKELEKCEGVIVAEPDYSENRVPCPV